MQVLSSLKGIEISQAVLYTLSIPSINKSTHGFGGQGGAHAASKSLKIRKYFLRPFHCLNTALTAKTAKHLTAMDFRVIFAF